jgi:hypothetical protein
MRASISLLYSKYARACVACGGGHPAPKGKLQWVAGPPHPFEATPEVRDVWAYRLEAPSPSKPIK